MKKGEMVGFMLPPDLGYGATGRNGVPPNCNWKLYDETKIGLGLIAFGILFSFLGTILFFDKGLLAMGNVSKKSSSHQRVTMTMRPKSLMQFFTKCSNFKVGWIMLGMILEAYGFIVLFSRFWSTLPVFVQKIPIIEWVFQQPFVRSREFSWISAACVLSRKPLLLVCCPYNLY
ncbi:hypothetical protein HYC85_012752 [Camellia sinensis]|uniref:peptidylprolyl isomerase n=1 Tax=Camellia sinensis TaxID=4442 RepID=A0A7J7HDE0_CAMSI|nr:hypothetical protein HYC85_012752 [Camellia sinensis]